jgi:hypothetical protein
MTSEQKVLLSLIKSQITETDISLSDFGDFDITKVISEAKAQAVFLMAMDKAASIKEALPKDVFQKEYQLLLMQSVKNAEVESSQKELVEILTKARKPYAIIKGEAAAFYYPRPELRILGDVDFLIDPKDKDELTEILKQNGYNLSQGDHPCHVVFKKPKSHLEMHFEVVGIPNGIMGDIVRDYMKDAVYKTNVRTSGVCPFSALSDAKNGLVMLLHMAHHMLGEGIGLRHLCDLACFVSKTAELSFWEEELIPLLQKIGLFHYAKAMIKTASVYLGVKCPDFAEDIDNILCEEIIEDIFSGGNFGRKDTAYLESGLMVSNHGKDGVKKSKLRYALEVADAAVKHHHTAVQRHKILYPVFFVYRLVRYFVLMLFGKKKSILETVPMANKRRKLYSRLNVFEVEEK